MKAGDIRHASGWSGGNVEKKQTLFYLFVSFITIMLILIFWYLITEVYRMVPSNMLPGPIRVFRTFITKFYETRPDGGTMLQHLAASLQVALSGYLIGVVIGVPLGIIMAWSKKADLFIRPLFDLVRPIPGIAWIPVMIILFGIGLFSKAMVIFLSSFTACVINSYSGIKQTKTVHLWVGQTFGASNIQLLSRIAIPTSLPMLLTGLRVALGSSWGALVAAEMLASTKGLGFMIQQNRGLLRPDVIIAGMITIGVVGAFLTYLLTLLERYILKGGRW
jgi:NitT/TauT family transport system permease protein/taurine transport system permease protein